MRCYVAQLTLLVTLLFVARGIMGYGQPTPPYAALVPACIPAADQRAGWLPPASSALDVERSAAAMTDRFPPPEMKLSTVGVWHMPNRRSLRWMAEARVDVSCVMLDMCAEVPRACRPNILPMTS